MKKIIIYEAILFFLCVGVFLTLRYGSVELSDDEIALIREEKLCELVIYAETGTLEGKAFFVLVDEDIERLLENILSTKTDYKKIQEYHVENMAVEYRIECYNEMHYHCASICLYEESSSWICVNGQTYELLTDINKNLILEYIMNYDERNNEK